MSCFRTILTFLLYKATATYQYRLLDGKQRPVYRCCHLLSFVDVNYCCFHCCYDSSLVSNSKKNYSGKRGRSFHITSCSGKPCGPWVSCWLSPDLKSGLWIPNQLTCAEGYRYIKMPPPLPKKTPPNKQCYRYNMHLIYMFLCAYCQFVTSLTAILPPAMVVFTTTPP